MTKSRAEEIVLDKNHPTKEERDERGLKSPLKKGWLRRLRKELAKEHGISTSRYGPAIENGVILRGKSRGKALSEASIDSLAGFLGSSALSKEEKSLVAEEWRKRGKSLGCSVSDKAIRTCLDKGMEAEGIVFWFSSKGLDVDLQRVLDMV